MPTERDTLPDRLAVSVRDIGIGVVLAVRGDLSLCTVPQLRRTLDKQLADRGRVLVDLSDLTVGWPPAMGVFPASLASMSGWPAARLVLFGARADLLSGAGQYLSAWVHVAGGEAEAVELLDVRPQRLSRRTELACERYAPKWARLLVDTAFEDWDVADVDVCAARSVVSELVTNAVQHARTSCAVALVLTDRALWIGVRDHAPRGRPPPAAAGPVDASALGMVIVAALSSAWGVIRHGDGKTVWASIRRGGPVGQ